MGNESTPLEVQGRKIFFRSPTVPVQSQIIEELVQQEFEVYIIKDHVKLSKALRKYANSIVFVNIDDGMPEMEWEKWIRGMMSTLPNVDFGILSANNDEEFKNKYLNDVRVRGGFFHLTLDMSKTVPKVLEVLKIMNAKGQRKYMRAAMDSENTATLNMSMPNGFVNGVIKDISVVGVSCAFEQDPELVKNALFKDIQVRLQTMLLKVEAIVFGSRMNGNEKIYVLLFTQRIDPEVRTRIRKYIQTTLQGKIDKEFK
jgi:hypothetical protein